MQFTIFLLLLMVMTIITIIAFIQYNKKLFLYKKELEQLKKEYSKIKVENLKSISHVIKSPTNQIIDLNKTQKSEKKILVNLYELITEITIPIKVEAIKRGLNFSINYKIDRSFIFLGDPLELSKIIINLLSTSIRFTKNGFISLYISKISDDRYRFMVEDSRNGVAKEIQDIVFKNENPKTENSYNVSLLKGAEILLIEDDSINQDIVIGVLEESGVHIDIANDGEEGIKLFEKNKNKYDLILMDLKMQRLGGFEATEIIRKKDKQIPIIALTADLNSGNIEKSKRVGMNEYLTKPIDVEKLHRVLLKYICKKGNLHNLKLIDTKEGLKNLVENKELYTKTLKLFYKKYSNINLEELNDKDFYNIIHSLKGVVKTIGAMKLAKIVEEIDDSKDRNLTNELKLELNKILKELNNNFYEENEQKN